MDKCETQLLSPERQLYTKKVGEGITYIKGDVSVLDD